MDFLAMYYYEQFYFDWNLESFLYYFLLSDNLTLDWMVNQSIMQTLEIKFEI